MIDDFLPDAVKYLNLIPIRAASRGCNMIDRPYEILIVNAKTERSLVKRNAPPYGKERRHEIA